LHKGYANHLFVCIAICSLEKFRGRRTCDAVRAKPRIRGSPQRDGDATLILSWLANIFGSDARCDMLEQDSANSNGEKQRVREEPRQAQTRAACSPPARGRQRRRVGDRSLSAPIRPSESDRCRSSPSPPGPHTDTAAVCATASFLLLESLFHEPAPVRSARLGHHGWRCC
jgi:hypothetical protein